MAAEVQLVTLFVILLIDKCHIEQHKLPQIYVSKANKIDEIGVWMYVRYLSDLSLWYFGVHVKVVGPMEKSVK